MRCGVWSFACLVLLGDFAKGSGFAGFLVMQFQATSQYRYMEDCAALFDVVYMVGTEC